VILDIAINNNQIIHIAIAIKYNVIIDVIILSNIKVDSIIVVFIVFIFYDLPIHNSNYSFYYGQY
jgi:hypothetical protein